MFVQVSLEESSSGSSSSSSSSDSSDSDSDDDDSSSTSSSSSSDGSNEFMSQSEISHLIDRCILGKCHTSWLCYLQMYLLLQRDLMARMTSDILRNSGKFLFL